MLSTMLSIGFLLGVVLASIFWRVVTYTKLIGDIFRDIADKGEFIFDGDTFLLYEKKQSCASAEKLCRVSVPRRL
jgi:hypothetical protein